MNSVCLVFLLCFAMPCLLLEAAPRRYSFEEENYQILRELRDSIEDLRHELNNHESEIRILEEKYTTQEILIDSLKQQQVDTQKASKDLLKGNTQSLEGKIASLESNLKGVLSDLKQMKEFLAQSGSKQRLEELKKEIEVQNQNIEYLQSSLTTIMQVLQGEKPAPLKITKESEKLAMPGSSIEYKVKQGDSLEKIAKNNKTTVAMIKEMNGLTKDRIVIGQTLKLPITN